MTKFGYNYDKKTETYYRYKKSKYGIIQKLQFPIPLSDLLTWDVNKCSFYSDNDLVVVYDIIDKQGPYILSTTDSLIEEYSKDNNTTT